MNKIKFYYFKPDTGKWKYEGEETFENYGAEFWKLIQQLSSRHAMNDLPGCTHCSQFTCIGIPQGQDGWPFMFNAITPD